MNKRIEELKAQARDFYLDRDDLTCSVQELHRLVEEKFVELLVQECVEVIEGSPWNLPRGYKAVDQAALVKKHFGVKQ
jgi:hypothetical protein